MHYNDGMNEQTTYTKTEQEIIILRAVWDLIDDMVNYRAFEKEHGTIDARVNFKTPSERRLFNILLADFLSRPKSGTFDLPEPTEGSAKTEYTFLFYLRRICENPILNFESASLQTPVQQFIDWLEGECFVEKVWFPSIEIETDIRIKRVNFLKICGNTAKHSFARLEVTADLITKVFKKNGIKIDIKQGFLALPDFYEWFHNDIFSYHASTIAEYLNNIRWGIFGYLQPEFSQSFEWLDAQEVGYRYNYPEDCLRPLAQAIYWDLMNKVRSRPFFPRFISTESLKNRY